MFTRDRLARSRTCISFMPRRKRPEHSRTNAMRSRWLGSMLAWTLNTKPVTAGSSGSTVRSRRLRGRGAGAHAASASSSSSHAEVAAAREPKNTGVRWPSRKRLQVERAAARCAPAPTLRSARARDASSSRAVGQRCRRCSNLARSRPRSRSPAGQQHASCRSRSRHALEVAAHADRPGHRRARRAPGRTQSRPAARAGRAPSRSILLMKVTIGMSRRRQTSNSLRVCALDALGRVDHHHRGVDRASACGRCPRRSPRGPACRAG